ncbi:para-nitrobenzyl esterase [Acidimicrobiaceae bacterium]|nr:para-nitrobenzyl esterase [Acidimicrobiaceae bacterium]
MASVINSSGSFTGNDLEFGLSEFLGIQFATAERFEAPKDILVYSTPVTATTFGAQSPQVPGFMEEILNTKNIPIDENCLYLNIWTKNLNSDSKNDLKIDLKPVLFWIHGGAYTNGTAATSWYNGSSLVNRGDVVVVSINYRLGPFGFLGENNFGTLDQISALRWVNRNIQSFGGDPNNVTIFGESAGGSSVVALTASPLVTGLVHKAWAMSPSLRQLRTKAESVVALEQYLNLANCDSISDLKKLSVQEMIDATAQMFADVENYISTFTPTCGGSGLPEDINEAVAKSGIPLVVGTNHDENRLWTVLHPESATLDDAGALVYFQKVFGADAEKVWDVYAQHRKDHSPSQMVAAFQTDENFRAPAWRLCENLSAKNTPTWMYWFTWSTPVFDGAFGSCHALDIPFVFDNLNAPGVELFTGNDSSRSAIADRISGELLSFAKTGKVSWSQYETSKRTTLKVDNQTVVLTDPEPELRKLWSAMA